MPSIIIGLFLLYLILYGIKQFSRVTPAQAARILRPTGGIMVVLLAMLRGRAGPLGLIASLLMALFGARGSIFGAAKGGPSPRTSVMRSAMIEMRLDHDSGAMSGTVLAGAYQGRDLSTLTRPMCRELHESCRNDDPEGARLLEAYFDRRFSGWRDADKGDGHTRRDSGLMSEDEAHEVLGLAKGAGPEEITRAHRTLMKKIHPDAGGTTSLAARVNEAKDILMRRHGPNS